MALLSLSEELLANIASFLHPESILPFALTSRKTYHAAKEHIKEHKRYHDLYAICHDRLPLTMPTLLRLATTEPEVAWHVRTLEFWGVRQGMETWKKRHYPLGGENVDLDPDWLDSQQDFSMTGDPYSTAEVTTWHQFIVQDLHLNYIRPDGWYESDSWFTRLRKGWDEPLKVLVMCLEPRLERVNFIAYDWDDDEIEYYTQPLTFLCRVVFTLYNRVDQPWPAGFLSLRRIDICTLIEGQDSEQAFYCTPWQVAPLFLLPNIKILNLSHLESDPDADQEFEFPLRSSTVEQLGLSWTDISEDEICGLLRAPARLIKLTTSSMNNGYTPGLMSVEEHASSLETWKCNGIDPSRLREFARLKVFEELYVEEFMLQLPDSKELPKWIDKRDPTVRCENESMEIADLRELLPESIQKVRLGYRPPSPNAGPVDYENEVLWSLLPMIADLVEDQRFEQLEEICLWDVWKDCGELEMVDATWERKEALARIKAKGVELHWYSEDNTMSSVEHSKLHPLSNTGLGEAQTVPQLESM